MIEVDNVYKEDGRIIINDEYIVLARRNDNYQKADLYVKYINDNFDDQLLYKNLHSEKGWSNIQYAREYDIACEDSIFLVNDNIIIINSSIHGIPQATMFSAQLNIGEDVLMEKKEILEYVMPYMDDIYISLYFGKTI